MKITVCMDSFKDSMTSIEASKAVQAGIKAVLPKAEIVLKPISDGGEGIARVLTHSLEGKTYMTKVKDPLFKEIEAQYGIINNEFAVIEMASASGLELIAEADRNPTLTTTYGTGELIKEAILKHAVKKIVVGIGGSATNDAGIGMLSALGYEFYDKNQEELSPIGGNLRRIRYIDDSNVLAELAEIEFIIACDVNNPLYGKNGASYIYGPQKGADEDMVIDLDQQLKDFSQRATEFLGEDYTDVPGAGAAGGLGFAFKGFLNGKLESGIDIVSEYINLEETLKDSDYVIVGEGKIDEQSSMGKAISGVIALGHQHKVKSIIIGGTVTDEAYKDFDNKNTTIFSIQKGVTTLTEALNKKYAIRNLKDITKQIFKLIVW